MRRLPPLGSIQAFVIVARLGTIKAAADALSLSSPALTRRIQSLEQFVGSPLFDRQPNAIRLNSRGNAFLAEAEPHVDALALAVERASYEAQRAERRYNAVDPDNRLVARGLEAEWEHCLRELEKAIRLLVP